MIIKIIFFLLIIFPLWFWPHLHYSHICPDRLTWKSSICPTAEVYEAYMFLQIMITALLYTPFIK